MERLEVSNFGPLKKIDVTFGDMTILVGAQASGKSLGLELLKLLVDRDHIVKTLDRYNYIWGHNIDKILNMYFGEGMSGVWSAQTKIMLDNREFHREYIPRKSEDKDEQVFYIPAQRILSMSDGRPKNFMEFDNTVPYVLREFSETLRLFMQNGLGQSEMVFPIGNRLKGIQKKSFDKSIFHGGKVKMHEVAGQKKMLMSVGNNTIPFMAWSAGQKEFMPLLLAFYCLSGPPSKVVKREKFKYVILEEPEMGLHPKAIVSIILQAIELMQRGYKVIVSTHSNVFLDFAWAFNLLQPYKDTVGIDPICKIFDIHPQSTMYESLRGIFDKTIRTYYFKHKKEGVVSCDITRLDAADEDNDMSEWGGISSFSSKTSDIIAEYMSSLSLQEL